MCLFPLSSGWCLLPQESDPEMSNPIPLKIAVVPGDGIGPEVIAAAIAVLRAAEEKVGGFALNLEELAAGAEYYRRSGEDISREAFEKVKAADILPEVPSEDLAGIHPDIRSLCRGDLSGRV